jgi:RNA polymerase sigma factor (sigma-70 family)
MDRLGGEDQSTSAGMGRTAFPTTHWETVLGAQTGGSADPDAALEILCRHYWYPLYSFARREGQSHHAAEDLTQAFLARLLATGGIDRVRPERGRFRTFLLTALRNFITNEWHRAQAAKRGGGNELLSLDFQAAESRFSVDPVDSTLTPEQAFDRTWALALIDQALATLQTEYAHTGRGPLFEAIAPLVWGGGARETQVEHVERLGLNGNALKVAVHRLRRRLRTHLQDQVRATVSGQDEVADELAHLMAVVSRPQSSL